MSTMIIEPILAGANNPSPDATQSKGHIASIDGLRALACLAVLSHHCYYHAGRYSWPAANVFGRKIVLTHLLSMGYLGVELFFVLSGFCLALPFLLRSDSSDWKRYAAHRIRRILPPYWWSFFILTLVNVIISHFDLRPFTTAVGFGVPNVQHWLWGFFLVAPLYNTAYWTLDVETRWYFLLPVLMYVLKRSHTVGLFTVTIIASVLYSLVQSRLPTKLSFLIGPLPLFLPLFALGIVAALIFTQKKASSYLNKFSRFGFASSLILMLCLTPSDPNHAFQFRCIFPAGLTSFFLLLLALYDPLVSRLFSWRPLVIVGTFSYSLYLIHLPIIHLAYSVTKQYNWSAWQQFCFYQGVVLSCCVAWGYLFYLVAEKPYIRKKAIQPKSAFRFFMPS